MAGLGVSVGVPAGRHLVMEEEGRAGARGPETLRLQTQDARKTMRLLRKAAA